MKPPDSFTFHRPADLPESCNSSPGALRTQLSGVQRKDSAIDPKKRPARGWSKKPSRAVSRRDCRFGKNEAITTTGSVSFVCVPRGALRAQAAWPV
jgi:hypothetical protein